MHHSVLNDRLILDLTAIKLNSEGIVTVNRMKLIYESHKSPNQILLVFRANADPIRLYIDTVITIVGQKRLCISNQENVFATLAEIQRGAFKRKIAPKIFYNILVQARMRDRIDLA